MTNCPRSIGRHGLPRTALLLALLALPVLPRAQAILGNEVVDPRTFGYVVGDKIRREVHLSVHADYRLDEGSLPKPGRLDRWLEVAEPEIRVEPLENGRRYHLTLTYQIFSAPLALETVAIPQQNLRILADGQALTTLIPTLRVTVAPLTAARGTETLRGSALQQDRAPAPIPIQERQQRLAGLVAGLLTLLLYAAWRRGLLAFITGRRLPFAGAVHDLQRLQRSPKAPAQLAAALKTVHGAINKTAGRAVFAHNLDDFLAAHPEFAGVRAELEQVFAASEAVFFAGAAVARPGSGVPELLQLCKRCSRIERRTAGFRPLANTEEPRAA